MSILQCSTTAELKEQHTSLDAMHFLRARGKRSRFCYYALFFLFQLQPSRFEFRNSPVSYALRVLPLPAMHFLPKLFFIQ